MGFINIMAQSDGSAIYGIWCCIVGACSQQKERDGWLTENGKSDGIPWEPQDLANKFRRPTQEVEKALQILSSQKVGWIQTVDDRALTAHSPLTPLERREEKEGSEGNVQRDDFSELIDEKTAMEQAATQNVPEDFARFVFLSWWATEGKNANGVKVRYDRYLVKRWSSERGEWQAGTHKGKKAQEAKVSTGPTRADVTKYAKEKGDENGIFAVSFYRHWESKDWKNMAGKSIDWQIKFSEQFAQHRMKNS